MVVAEGGWLNFFRSQQPGADGTLPVSRLGEVGAKFCQFTKRHPDRGIPYTPVGLLVDFYHGIYPGFGENLTWNAFPYTQGDQRILDVWDILFPDSIDVMTKPDETGYLVASPFGDIIDVLLTNAPDAILASYPVLVLAGELTDAAALAPRLRAYVKKGGTLILSKADATRPQLAHALNTYAVNEPPEYTRYRLGRGVVVVYAESGTGEARPLFKILANVRNELVPFRISGKIESLFNRTADGWIVTLVNNEGITKAFKDKSQIDVNTTQMVTVIYTGRGRVRSATLLGLETDETLNPSDICITLPPGEVRVLQVVTDPALHARN